MKTTQELIKTLRESSSVWMQGDWPYNTELPLAAAKKLEELQRFIDDMLGDHYVDYLDFYTSRCRELEDELEYYKNIVNKITEIMGEVN